MHNVCFLLGGKLSQDHLRLATKLHKALLDLYFFSDADKGTPTDDYGEGVVLVGLRLHFLFDLRQGFKHIMLSFSVNEQLEHFIQE